MIKCRNRYCKHHCDGDKCSLKKAYIGVDATCENYEKGFLHYFYYLLGKSRSNFITDVDLNEDMRYSIYYLMKCLPIMYGYDGNRGIITFKDKENPSKIISIDAIYDMIATDRLDNDALNECIKDFMENGLPKPEDDGDDKEPITHEYGWLSPTGEFIESSWGTHEESAREIVERKKWGEEYNNWLESQDVLLEINYRDFLSQAKKYVLIHDPGNTGYRVTGSHKLTKKQKEFLYGYFKDMGMTMRAEAYLDE